MKITREKLPASQIGLEIEITPEVTRQTYEQVVKKLAKSTQIPGFRKGKVPRPILLQHLGTNRIKAAALEEMLQDGIEKAIEQEQIAIIGKPQLCSDFEELIVSYQPGQSFTFSAAVDIPPKINLLQYNNLSVKAEEIKYDPEKINLVIDQERQQMATLIPIEDRSAQLGDVAIVDFKGVLAKDDSNDQESEPTPIPGGENSNFQVDLQEGNFIPGFITGIVGMNSGETKEIIAEFPSKYADENLAGRSALFTVTLKELKEKELPELDDDFAREVSEFNTLEELKDSLAERFRKEAEEKTKSNQHEALLIELIKYVEVDLPATMIEQEIDSMLTQTAMKLAQQGLDVKQLFTREVIPQLRERSREEAIERLKRSLALREIATRESLITSEEEISTRIAALKEDYPEENIDSGKLREVVENEIFTDKIMSWIMSHSSIELVPEGSLKAVEEKEAQ
ncbi:Cell division trigger factor [Richelia intracellularis HH01]|uniref:Trigger factor n=1 Tax=Richelia intracellularis HH01 TaxID=1165094 RepID=M1WTV2_9NOST|nr:trigger factor [Richelia intracellularis]CCH68414.1 Cell division trigger factor [Richelia intracellularis HH01]